MSQPDPVPRAPVIGSAGRRIWNLALELIEPAPPGRLLEAAAGGGFLSSELAAKGHEVIGTDFVDQWQYPDIPFQQVDLDEPLPFADGSFDAIVFTEAIGYIENPCATIREFHRVLRPGGVVVITMPNVFALQTRFKFLMSGTYRWFPHPIYRGQTKSELSDVYRDPIRLTTLIFNLERHGFEWEETRFGGGKALQIFKPLGWMLLGLTKLENKFRKKRQTPELVNRSDSLFRLNVGVRVRRLP